MSERGELKKQIQRMIWTHGYPSKSLVENLLDEARKDLESKAKTVNDCELFPNCWGKVVRLDDVLKWFGSR